jgi:hypothetical protein
VKYLPQGEIRTAARVAGNPHPPSAKRNTYAQKQGLRFQEEVKRWAFGGNFLGKISEGPWFAYEDESSSVHFCQPDFLFDDSHSVVVVEAKFRFSADAWWQLRKLYLPVVQKLLPSAYVIPLCVCKSFDPSVVCPEVPHLVRDLFDCAPGRFNVLVLS